MHRLTGGRFTLGLGRGIAPLFDAGPAHVLHRRDRRALRGDRAGAAEQAGRDPAAVRIWSCFATVHDGLPEALRVRKTVGRMATYLQGYGDLMVATNGWDPAVLARFRADPVVASFPGALDAKADADTLAHVATLIPDEWLEPAATGSPERCAERVLRQFDLGVDGVIMHGATPAELAPVVAVYRTIRPAGRFDHLTPNPGR
jgi:alkanesulfonate monooxygenase SsuD/methylene tetrahydromethanopterin reductase-like flavin-dependent oxidoreductase (luciferase family)